MVIPNSHRLRSIRLKEYVYSQPGGYFVTIVTHDRIPYFGKIIDVEMQLNPAGRMVEKWWLKLPKKFPGIEIHEYCVMPNHFHGITVIVGADRGTPVPMCRQTSKSVPATNGENLYASAPLQKLSGPPPLSIIIQWWKTMTTNEYIHGVKEYGWQPFCGKLWQRSYFDHIIRNDAEWNQVRDYVITNPMNSSSDQERRQ